MCSRGTLGAGREGTKSVTGTLPQRTSLWTFPLELLIIQCGQSSEILATYLEGGYCSWSSCWGPSSGWRKLCVTVREPHFPHPREHLPQGDHMPWSPGNRLRLQGHNPRKSLCSNVHGACERAGEASKFSAQCSKECIQREQIDGNLKCDDLVLKRCLDGWLWLLLFQRTWVCSQPPITQNPEDQMLSSVVPITNTHIQINT
jgi:hypothetical protein